MENKIDLIILTRLSKRRKEIPFMKIFEETNKCSVKKYDKGYILRRVRKLEKIAMISTEKVGRMRMIKIRELGRTLLRVYKWKSKNKKWRIS